MSSEHIYDVIGVGFGPANLALAIAMEEQGFKGSVRFFESKPEASWQQQMLLKGSDIQNNPARDLVTPRNPRSRYTFLNFLFENDRLYEHLNLGLEFPLRSEFAQYVQWVASFFEHQVSYDSAVSDVHYSEEDKLFHIVMVSGEIFKARAAVVAPGRTPRVPKAFRALDRSRAFHLTEYQSKLNALALKGKLSKVAVVGGSQSAIEIILDLHARFPELEIHNVQRGLGFRLKDTSQFSEHVYFPSFVDYYFDSTKEAKSRINRHLHFTNYSAADADVIKELYVTMYQDRLAQQERVFIHGFTEVENAQEIGEKTQLSTRELNRNEASEIANVDAIVLATGFCDLGSDENAERCPGIIASLYPSLKLDDEGVIVIERDYRLLSSDDASMGPLYLNGLCESSHGYGDAGSFSLLSLRSQEILESLCRQLDKASESTSPLETV
ncbi:putative L-ornithine 5-monooxygenase [Vibrio halioticoli NBRC 102217]|uniref:Putative L-ornithine 5-monooxygenase n=1 Tax=Vibrio halioticoli NBRC 102217 TaxID=1219072 RepID=V5FJS1_9VIBR|nr:SidA/IucD/PvdA family monooxygenase [Vibrio halioticoli]GAD89996.1 putative L-ornithine 5-monooxygenase [Vibrio halioticoli NBRC 102217]